MRSLFTLIGERRGAQGSISRKNVFDEREYRPGINFVNI